MHITMLLGLVLGFSVFSLEETESLIFLGKSITNSQTQKGLKVSLASVREPASLRLCCMGPHVLLVPLKLSMVRNGEENCHFSLGALQGCYARSFVTRA